MLSEVSTRSCRGPFQVYSKDRGYCEYMVDQVLTRDGKAGSNYCHQPGPGQRPNQANVSGCAFATYVLYNALQEAGFLETGRWILVNVPGLNYQVV